MTGLQYIRKKKGMSQEAVGALLGVTKQMVYRWEHGQNKLSQQQIRKLSAAFECQDSFITTDELTEEQRIEIDRFFLQKDNNISRVETYYHRIYGRSLDTEEKEARAIADIRSVMRSSDKDFETDGQFYEAWEKNINIYNQLTRLLKDSRTKYYIPVMFRILEKLSSPEDTELNEGFQRDLYEIIERKEDDREKLRKGRERINRELGDE